MDDKDFYKKMTSVLIPLSYYNSLKTLEEDFTSKLSEAIKKEKKDLSTQGRHYQEQSEKYQILKEELRKMSLLDFVRKKFPKDPFWDF